MKHKDFKMSNYQSFTLDTESAKQADAGGRIESTGKYVGVIKSMEFVTAKSGAQGFEINFESDSKEYTTFTIWTTSKDGKPLSGVHKINALMACCSVRGLTPTDKELEKYDFDAGQKVKRICVVAPEMTDKKVGLLLQRENYINNNGQQRHQMNFFASFNATSELMAKEILDKKTSPELIEKTLSRLLTIGDATRNQQGVQQQSSGYGAQQNTNQNNDLDDDLPF